MTRCQTALWWARGLVGSAFVLAVFVLAWVATPC